MGFAKKIGASLLVGIIAVNLFNDQMLLTGGLLIVLCWLLQRTWRPARQFAPTLIGGAFARAAQLLGTVRLGWLPAWLAGGGDWRRQQPRLVNLEGPPGAGKTWSTENVDWARLFGCDAQSRVELTAETIPPGVMSAFYTNMAVVGYTFDHYMVAIRLADEAACRRDPSTTVHLRDRTLIGSAAFHAACYTFGTLDRAQFDELAGLGVLARALEPADNGQHAGHLEPGDAIEPRRVKGAAGRKPHGAVPAVVVVYFGADFATCLGRVIARGGRDKDIPARYLQIVAFTYAYLIAHLVHERPDIGFLLATGFDRLGPGTIDYAAQRESVRAAALANLDIVLTEAERARFMYAMAGRTLGKTDCRWHDLPAAPGAECKSRFWSATAEVADRIREIQQFAGAEVDPDAKKTQ